ncbi:hypothetical protein ACOME3_010468, partial [Neoechinorhynchus agilis]
RNTSTLLLMRILVAAQLFKLKLISEEELMAGGLVSGLGVFCPTFEALTTRQARISMVTRRLLSRARAILATVFPDLIESIIGPPLPSPLTEKRAEGEPVTVLPPEDLNLASSILPEKTMIQQDQLSTITQTFGASPTDLISSATPTPSRAKFRAAVDKVLTKKRIEFKEILSQNQKQVESTREALTKRPRDPVLLGILEESRTAQLKIDSSLALIEKVAEEFQALSHLDDLPVMTTYNDDLDLESLPNSPVDLGTAFLAYMTRAKATVGIAEHVRVEKREKREKYRNYNSFVPTDKNGSFTRDMEAAVRNLKYEAAFVGATTITEKADNVEHKLRNDVRVRAHYLLNKIGTSKKRLMGLCFAHRNNQPMLHALAHGLNSRNQRLCAIFCRELDLLNGQSELVENLEWRATRRTALLASVRNRHFRRFSSSGWLSPDAISTLAGNGVSSFTSSYISSVLAGGDGYGERLSEEWNRLMHSMNGNSIRKPYVPVGYQMTVEFIQSTDHVSKVVTALAGNYSLFRTLPATTFSILSTAEPAFLHQIGMAVQQDDSFLTDKAKKLAEADVSFYKDKTLEERRALHYYLCNMPHLAETYGPICFSLDLSYSTSGPIGAEYNELWRNEESVLRPGMNLDPKDFHIISPGPTQPPTTISSSSCLDRVFSLVLSDDLDTSARMDFTRLLHTVSQVAPLLRRRNEKMAYLTLCGSAALDHYRDGSPATFARLRAILSTDNYPAITAPPPNGNSRLNGDIRRMWVCQPFEIVWLRMSIVDFFRCVAVNNLVWNEGPNVHNSAFDGRTLAVMEQYFPAPAEQLHRTVATVWNPILTEEIYMNHSGVEDHYFSLMDAFAKEPGKIFIVVSVTLEEIATRVQRFSYTSSSGPGPFPYDNLGLAILNGSFPNEPLNEIPCQEELLSYLALSNNSLEYQVMGRLNVPYGSGVRIAWNYDPGFYFYPLIQLGLLKVSDLPATQTRMTPENELKYYSAQNILPCLRLAMHKLSLRLDTMQVSVKAVTPDSSWTLGSISDILPTSDRTILGIISAYLGAPMARAFAAWARDPEVTIIHERTILHWVMISKALGISFGSGALAYSEYNGRSSVGVSWQMASHTQEPELTTKFFLNNSVWSIVPTEDLDPFRIGLNEICTPNLLPLITLKGFVGGARSDITFRGALLPRGCRGQYDVITIGSLFAIQVKINALTRLRFSLAHMASWETRFDKGTFDVPRNERYTDPLDIASCFEGDSLLAPMGLEVPTSSRKKKTEDASERPDASAED